MLLHVPIQGLRGWLGTAGNKQERAVPWTPCPRVKGRVEAFMIASANVPFVGRCACTGPSVRCHVCGKEGGILFCW